MGKANAKRIELPEIAREITADRMSMDPGGVLSLVRRVWRERNFKAGTTKSGIMRHQENAGPRKGAT